MADFQAAAEVFLQKWACKSVDRQIYYAFFYLLDGNS